MQNIVNFGRTDEQPIRLTPRERDVLALICQGLPNKLICRELGMAMGTVKCHTRKIFRELNAASRLQAALVARDHGLLNSGSLDS